MSWAFYIVISKRVLKNPEVTVMSLTLWVMGTTLVFLLPAAAFQLAVGNASLASVGSVGWAVAVYTGICCSTVAYLLYTRGLRSVTATISAVLLLVMILVAASMDYVFQGKGLDTIAMVGAGILLVAMVLVNLSSKEQDVVDVEPPAG
jgi:DME family drug/metabolite transporter